MIYRFRLILKMILILVSCGAIVSVIVLLLGSPKPTLSSNQSSEAPQRRENQSSPDTELLQVGNRIVSIIRTGDAEGLIAASSKRGVAFGIDQPEITLDELRRQAREKRGVFCLIFETKCLQKQPGFERSLSYRQLLAEADGFEIKTNIVRDSDVLAGTVSVSLKGAVADKAPDFNPIEFHFVREDAKWKLGAIPY